MKKNPVIVCVTGAGGQIGYSLVPFIASGLMLGENQTIILHLLEVEQGESSLKGLVLELEDSGYHLVKEIVATTKPEVAFKDIDIAIFVGAFPRLKEWIEKIYFLKMQEYSKNLD